MARSSLRPLALLAALLLLPASGAFAQEPGVTFDDGPSSKEYAIPLEAARAQTRTKSPASRNGSSSPATSRSASASAPPPPDTSAGTTSGDRSTSSSPDRRTRQTRDAGTDDERAQTPVDATARPAESLDTRRAATASDGLGAGVVIAGLAAAALALGALGGLVLRRRRAPG
jgi:hypothetical protein